MDNTSVTHADTHMDNASLGVLEESEVVTLHVTQADLVAAGYLL